MQGLTSRIRKVIVEKESKFSFRTVEFEVSERSLSKWTIGTTEFKLA